MSGPEVREERRGWPTLREQVRAWDAPGDKSRLPWGRENVLAARRRGGGQGAGTVVRTRGKGQRERGGA